MKKILHSKTSFFYEGTYFTSGDFFKKTAQIGAYFQKQGVKENTVCLVELNDPLQTIMAIFALAALKSVIALKNPKLPLATSEHLLSHLGPHVKIDKINIADDLINLDFNPKKITFLMATSGSSGFAKWVASSLDHWVKSAEGSLELLEATSYQPWVLNLPLFHVSGLSIVFRSLVSNAPLVIDKSNSVINRGRYSMVPHQIAKAISDQTIDRFLKSSSLLIGGQQLCDHLFMQIRHLPIYLTYGMTEACSQISCSEKSPIKPHTGLPLKHRSIQIDDQGAIFIAGESVCDFFWMKNQLLPLKDTHGFYKTGDFGFFDEKNRLHILGRKDEKIEIYGEKIFPIDIEKSLNRDQIFKMLIVTHIKDENHEPLIVAFCDPRPSNQVIYSLKNQVSSLFFPKYFFDIPSCSSSKILLNDLKRIARDFIFHKSS